MKKVLFLRSVAVWVILNFVFSIVAPSIAIGADYGKVLEREYLAADGAVLPRAAAAHPGALADFFEGDTKEAYDAYSKVIKALNEGFRNAIVLDPVYTTRKDTAMDGDNENRKPALDIFNENGVQIRIPRGKTEDAEKVGLDYFVLPIILPESIINGKLAGLKTKKDEKSVTEAVIKYLTEILAGNVNIAEAQGRSSALDLAALGKFAWDKTSTIAVMTKTGDILIQIPFWMQYNEMAMSKLVREIQGNLLTVAPVVDNKWTENADVSTHEKALKFLTTNAWHFFDELSKGDYTNVGLLTDAINNIDVTKIVNAEGIIYDPILGVFKSEKDKDEKVPYFGKNLEGFLASLNTIQQLVQLAYFLAVPSIVEEKPVAVPNRALQNAVSNILYRAYTHFDTLAVGNFNDPVVFEPIRTEIGRFADALNSAIRADDAIAVNGTKLADLFSYLESRGIVLSDNEKEAIIKLYEMYKLENGQWLYDILQLAEILTPDNFAKAMIALKVGDARKALPQDKPLEVFDGTGRIGTMGLALRIAGDVNNKMGEYTGRYGLRTRALNPKEGQTKLNAAVSVVEEMFSDSVVAVSELALKTENGQEVPIAQLLENDRLKFQAGDSVLNAQQDFGVTVIGQAVYPVNITLDGKLIGKVYVVDATEYEGAVKQAGVKEDNIPRPLIVKDGKDEVVFSVLTDATPGGVWIGDGIIEKLLDPKDFEKMTAWQLVGVSILPESGLISLKKLVSDDAKAAIANKIKDEGLRTKVQGLIADIEAKIAQGVSAADIIKGISKEDLKALQKGIKESKIAKIVLGEAKEELNRLVELLQQIDSTRIKDSGAMLDYNKAQILKKLLLPLSGGIHFMGRYIHKLPIVKEEGSSFYTPTSCSTNGASYFGLMLSTLCGCGTATNSIMGITFHMYTSGDAKGVFGDLNPKSTGAAKGVSQHFPVTALFTAVRTPTGLLNGKHDIVGGSAFYFTVSLQNPINGDVLKKFLERVGAQYPEILRMFTPRDKDNGEYTWKDTIGGQRTGSIMYEDLIQQVTPNTFVVVVGYDNEMSYSFKMRENGDARDLARVRQQDKRRRYLGSLFGKAKEAVVSNKDVSVNLGEASVSVGETKDALPAAVSKDISRVTGVAVKNYINPDVANAAYGAKLASAVQGTVGRLENLLSYFAKGMRRVIDKIGNMFTKLPDETTYMIRADQVTFEAEIVDNAEAKKLEEDSLYQTIKVKSSAIGVAKTLEELSKKNPKAKVVLFSPKYTIAQMKAILDAIDANGYTNVVLKEGDAASVYGSLSDIEKKNVVLADTERYDELKIQQVIVNPKEEGKTLHHMPFFNLMMIMSAYAVISPTQTKLGDAQVEEIISLYRMWLELPENGYTPDQIASIIDELKAGLSQDKPSIPLPPLPAVESLLKLLDAQYASGIETYA
jgi:hypothetical protein